MPASQRTWIFTIALIIFNILFFWIKPEGKAMTIVSDILTIRCALVALGGTALAVRSFGTGNRARLAWILLLTGVTLFFCAETINGFLEIILNGDVNDGFPILADYFRMTAYIPVLAGLLMLVFGYKKSRFSFGSKRNFIFGLLGLSLIAFTFVHQLLLSILRDADTGNLAKSVYIYYFAGGLLITFPAALLVYISSLYKKAWILSPWRYLAMGLLCLTIFTIEHSYLSWNNTYGSGNFLEVFRNLGYLLVAIGGLYQKELIESV